MAWLAKTLRGNTVYARVNDKGELESDSSGRVDIVYKLSEGAKLYRASSRNLMDSDNPEHATPVECDIAPLPAKSKSLESATQGTPLGADAVIIYTDGACTGNPGPMGIGAVIMDGKERVEIGEFIGQGTNNIAELTAIHRALKALPESSLSRPVVVHTDSSYCIGVLSKGWKAKANIELIANIKKTIKGLSNLRFVKVKGHAGIPENERCDELATSAISSR
jgi:ribonuclease HI